jgi:hypothetical protein
MPLGSTPTWVVTTADHTVAGLELKLLYRASIRRPGE